MKKSDIIGYLFLVLGVFIFIFILWNEININAYYYDVLSVRRYTIHEDDTKPYNAVYMDRVKVKFYNHDTKREEYIVLDFSQVVISSSTYLEYYPSFLGQDILHLARYDYEKYINGGIVK